MVEFEIFTHPIILSQMIKVRLHNFMIEIVLSIVEHIKMFLYLGFLKSVLEACERIDLFFLQLMTFFNCQRWHCDQTFCICIISVLPLFMQGENNTHHAVLVNGIRNR